jgi:hypothetical protein
VDAPPVPVPASVRAGLVLEQPVAKEIATADKRRAQIELSVVLIMKVLS